MENSYIKLSDYEVLTPSGFKDFDGISKITKKCYYSITLDNNEKLKCSSNHKIDTPSGYKYTSNLSIGDMVITKKHKCKITEITCVNEDIDLFDLINVKDKRHRFFANNTVVSNCAFVPNRQWDAFISSVYPTISSSDSSRVIKVSTFNGLNHFYQDWEKANSTDPKVKSEFKAIRVDWWQVPGRDNPDSPILKKFEKSLHEYLKIYEEPKKKHNYVIGVDSAKMTEENAGDALGMQVLDITEFPIRQVATFFAKEGISYLQCPNIIAKLGTYYNEAYVFIENNEIGQEVANMVNFDCEYENTYFEKGDLAGYRTTKKTKRIGCDNLRLLLENKKLILSDFNTISQLSTFAKKKDSYCAESGYQDDLVMALISALFFLQAKKMDFDLIENTSDLGNKILSALEKPEEEDAPLTIYIEEVEVIHSDFDWL
jgi:hypothetical protein